MKKDLRKGNLSNSFEVEDALRMMSLLGLNQLEFSKIFGCSALTVHHMVKSGRCGKLRLQLLELAYSIPEVLGEFIERNGHLINPNKIYRIKKIMKFGSLKKLDNINDHSCR